MRILLPTMRDPGQIGGTSTHIAMLTQGLIDIGHEVTALYLGATVPGPVRKAGLVWPAGALNRVRTGWGMVYAAEARGRLLATKTARECARASAAGVPWEILNVQEVYSVPYLRSVADEYGIPLVLTLHGYPLYESVSEGYSTASRMGLGYLMRAEMRALRLADAVVTVDRRLYRHALGLVPERAGSIYTLMNFIDTSTFAPFDDPQEEARVRSELRATWEVPEDKTVLFCPRRLVKKNGVVLPSLALAAMEPAERDRFLLLHAGDGGERQEMERIVRENGLEDHVRLLGGKGRDDILDLYRLADIVLVPSVHSENVEEATSLSALEAMASGRPLIAGDVGGLAEMVVDGETGLLVPADPRALAAAILRLAAAPDLGARMAAAARCLASAWPRPPAIRRPQPLPSARRDGLRRGLPPGGGERRRRRGSRRLRRGAGHRSPRRRPTGRLLGARLAVTLRAGLHARHRDARAGRAVGHRRSRGGRRGGGGLCGAALRHARTRLAVSFNPELVIRAQSDPAAATALLEADLCYPDGVGAVWAAGRQGARLPAGAAGRQGARLPIRDGEAASLTSGTGGRGGPCRPCGRTGRGGGPVGLLPGRRPRRGRGSRSPSGGALPGTEGGRHSSRLLLDL